MWLESHGNLARHPKTRRLMQRMGWTLPHTIGNLHLLWWWALEYAPTGDLTRFEPEQITDDLDLGNATPAEFLEAMIEAGFIDRERSGTLRIHDWPEYTAKSLRPKFRKNPDRWHQVLRSYGLPVVTRRKPALSNFTRNSAPAPEPSTSTCAERDPKLVGNALRAVRRTTPADVSPANDVDEPYVAPNNGDAIAVDSESHTRELSGWNSNAPNADAIHASPTSSFQVDLDLVPKCLSGRRNFNDWWLKLLEQYQNKGCPMTAPEQVNLLALLARNPFTAVEKLQYSVVNFEKSYATLKAQPQNTS